MAGTTFSSREFNQNTSRAKRAAKNGPVFVTDRGQPSHVLLSIDEYRKLTGKNLSERKTSLADLLAMPGADLIEFDPPRLGDEFLRPAEFDE
jgi:prevent-host-death family protein